MGYCREYFRNRRTGTKKAAGTRRPMISRGKQITSPSIRHMPGEERKGLRPCPLLLSSGGVPSDSQAHLGPEKIRIVLVRQPRRRDKGVDIELRRQPVGGHQIRAQIHVIVLVEPG